MTTRINVTVGGVDLAAQSKRAQQSNRTAFVNQSQEKEAEQRGKEKLERLRQQAEQQRQGAVPEYGIREQTSAQRGEDWGIGWMYETYVDSFEHPWATKEQYRVAYGSGDGTKWQYIDLEQLIPTNLPPATVHGFYEASVSDEQKEYIDTVTVFFVPHPRRAEWQRVYSVQRQNIKFVVPIGGSRDAGCIVVGSAKLSSKLEKNYSPIPVGFREGICTSTFSLSLTTGDFIGCLNQGDIIEQVVANPNIGTRITYHQNIGSFPGVLLDYTEEEVPLTGNIYFTPDGETTYVYVSTLSPYNYDGYDGSPTSTFGEPSYTYAYYQGFKPPDDIVESEETTQVNYAFFISEKRCTRLEISGELEEALSNLPYTGATDGPAWGYVYDYSDTFNEQIVYGSPGIYDIIKADYDFDLFAYDVEDPQPIKSKVTPNIPITAPDYTSSKSAFSYSTQIEAINESPNVEYPRPSIYYSSRSSPLYLLDYIYLPEDQKDSSAYANVATSDSMEILQTIAERPEFWLWTKKNNPGGVIYNYNEEDPTEILLPTLLPDGAYKNVIRLRLSKSRVLPPALFANEHPMIMPQVTRSNEGLGSFVSGFFEPTVVSFIPYSDYKLVALLWTDWGAGRQNRTLNLLGIVAP